MTAFHPPAPLHRIASLSARDHASGAYSLVCPRMCARVALTREAGKNAGLRAALAAAGVVQAPSGTCVELPCVETVEGPDRGALAARVHDDWAWVVVTSPEAAAVLCSSWKGGAAPPLRVAAVGDATARALAAEGVVPEFVPSKATGRSLVVELPSADEAQIGFDVLYPASALASRVVQDGLDGKGYRVTRLDTYSTCPREWTQVEKNTAADVHVVTFAAPSAVKSWVRNAGVKPEMRVACIGETSAEAALKAGFVESNIFYPEKPGMDGWVGAVKSALEL